MNSLICQNEKRREVVRQQQDSYGLDYLEVVAEDQTQRTLRVFFLGKVPDKLEKTNFVIEGGRRIRGIKIVSAETVHHEHEGLDDYVEIAVDKAGDFSGYTLRGVEKNTEGKLIPHHLFDPRYDRLNFNFKIDCYGDLDCQQENICPPELRLEPEINYLTKDYASFRQLLLDRLSVVMPDWQERHEADLGITLVELLAYTGDYLSYYQEAVATEAYLDTARQRISVRRHARLVDYQLHEGCNARTWVCVEVSSDLKLIASDTFFVTNLNNAAPNSPLVLQAYELDQIPASGYEAFEPLSKDPLSLFATHNEIHFYGWGDSECCLPRGATNATLIGELATPDEKSGQEKNNSPLLHLKVGDVLIFEEIIGPETGNVADADLRHRHAIRLRSVIASTDPLNDTSLVEIEWAEEDALPFPLCLSVLGPAPACNVIENVSVARGNCILTDHGATIIEDLGSVLSKPISESCECEGELADTAIIAERFNPHLRKTPLVCREILASGLSAARALRQDPHKALPQIRLTSDPAIAGNAKWRTQRDLLSSHSNDQHFVAEIDNDGRAHLRFGDGELGRLPEAGMQFQARYRIGQATAGNVGAETIRHLVGRTTNISGGVTNVRNPFPAQGGIAPEPMAEAKLFAPYALRKDLQRAVTATDYATIVEREFKDKVQRAVAQLCWTGSGYEVVVAVDPFGREEVEDALRAEIAVVLNRYRRIGHDVKVISAARVPLTIGMIVCVKPHYLSGHVKAALLNLFSQRILPDGRKGFFHPDNLTFGEGIFLSKLVAAAFAIEGVENVHVTTLQRLNETAHRELETGVLQLNAFEIAQCDNDPSFPEHGQLTLEMRGGR